MLAEATLCRRSTVPTAHRRQASQDWPVARKLSLVSTEEVPLLSEAIPELAKELEEGLRADGENDLADEVASLRMVASCGCGDDFCASFYTGPRPQGAWGADHETLVTQFGLILEVVDHEIRYIEILWRDDLRHRVLQVFGER